MKLSLLYIAMIELLQAPWCALGWGSAFRSSRCEPLRGFTRRSLMYTAGRCLRGLPGLSPFNLHGVRWASGDSSADKAVAAKGEYHLLPRLFVGVEPTLQTFEFRGTNQSNLVDAPHVEAVLPPLLNEMSRVQLSEDQSHYLTSVLRLLKKRKNEPIIRLFDGRSGEWLCRVLTDDLEAGDEEGVMHKKKKHKRRSSLYAECLSLLRPQWTSRASNEASSPCWLCVPAPASKERWRWMLEKATELNVDRLVLLETDYSCSSQRKVPGSLRKAHSYLVEAAEQAERLTLPVFTRLVPAANLTPTAKSTSLKPHESDERDAVTTKLIDLLDFVRAEPALRLLVCRERTLEASGVSLWHALADANDNRATIAFCIGPEGGWSPSEESRLDKLEAQCPSSIINVSLGPTVLRVETAAISALSAYNVFYEDRLRRA